MAEEAGEEVKALPQISIDTPRLHLRGAQMSDTEDLFECFSDAEAMLYWDTLPHATVDVTRKWVEKMVQGCQNGVTDFVICLKETDKEQQQQHQRMAVIGKVGIWHGDEIGFMLTRRHWRKGLAVEAVCPVLDLAFGLDPHETVQLNKHDDNDLSKDPKTFTFIADDKRDDVVADVDPRNTASLAILTKLGFDVYATKEKTFQVGDQWVDSVYLSLKRDTWVVKRRTVQPG